jgi:hypothetical protein
MSVEDPLQEAEPRSCAGSAPCGTARPLWPGCMPSRGHPCNIGPDRLHPDLLELPVEVILLEALIHFS